DVGRQRRGGNGFPARDPRMNPRAWQRSRGRDERFERVALPDRCGQLEEGPRMVVDPVIAALQEQVTCYQRLAKLAELQHEHVQQSSTEALLDVLARRQEVLDHV